MSKIFSSLSHRSKETIHIQTAEENSEVSVFKKKKKI